MHGVSSRARAVDRRKVGKSVELAHSLTCCPCEVERASEEIVVAFGDVRDGDLFFCPSTSEIRLHMKDQQRRFYKPQRTKAALIVHSMGVATSYVAWRLGVSHSYVCGVLNGTQKPSDEFLERLAELLDIRNTSPKSLLDTVDSPTFSRSIRAYLGVS